MAVATDELLLLERVFLRIGSAETDEQLQNAVSKFLPPVLLKLSSTQEGVRKKVMELLVHINKRIKSRPLVQLPVEALLVQYQDPAASSFVTNFTIIYLKMGFPRLSIEKQTELVPAILNSLEAKPQSHQDSLLLMIIPLLGHVKVPADPAKRTSLFGLNEKPQVAKELFNLMFDMLLLPYGATSPPSTDDKTPGAEVKFPVPPGMSEYSYKRITTNNPLKPEDLEQIKLGIVKFDSLGVFSDQSILMHLLVAAADTRFSVANAADMELKKIVNTLNWSSVELTSPLYVLLLGTAMHYGNTTIKPEKKRQPASTRIRLKALHYLCRATGEGFIFPISIKVIFDHLLGTNTNPRLKSLALTFAGNLIRDGDPEKLSQAMTVLRVGFKKFIDIGEPQHLGQTYVLMGQMARKLPLVFGKDMKLLEEFLNTLVKAPSELRLSIREALLAMVNCYKITEPQHTNDVLDLKQIESNIQDPEKVKDISMELHLIGLISYCLRSDEPIVRFVAVRYAAVVFPDNHVCSRYLLLLATGDSKDEVFMESLKALYGSTRRNDNDFDSEHNNSQDLNTKKTKLPDFIAMCAFVAKEAMIRKTDERRYEQGNSVLPFAPPVYTEILAYLRLCLAQGANMTLSRGIALHPTEKTPLLSRYLRSFFDEARHIDDSHPLKQYLTLIQEFMTAFPGIVPISCLLEIFGCIPDLLYKEYIPKLTWFRGFLNSTKEEIREHASVLYGVLTAHGLHNADYDQNIEELITTAKNNKNLETQHGSILAIAHSLERRITLRRKTNILHGVDKTWSPYKQGVELIISFLDDANPLLISAACVGVGLLGRCYILPLTNDKTPKDEKEITKFGLVNKLLTVMNNIKYQTKLRERAATSLGLLCVGEIFPFTRDVIEGLLNTAKETKDVEVHFSVGESLVMCVQSIWSNEARDHWSVLPDEFSPEDTMIDTPCDDDLNWLLDELLKLVHQPHPNSRQATCIWLLSLLKQCSGRNAIKTRLASIEQAFKDLLSENSDIVQDVASKGLGLVYENCDEKMREEMLAGLLDQLQSGRREVKKVSTDTKLFEEGQLGKSPTGGNLTTYKELCSLASDLNKPDLIFKFMNLANHNAIWNSKKGAAFGFSSIASKAGEQIAPYLPKIIPRLYRYQFDPTPNLQASMHRIWNELVKDRQKTLDTYQKEILADLIENLTNNQWRVRLSTCLALQDFLRGSANRSIHDYSSTIEELWKQLFRVMDDVHEGTRNAAGATAKFLSKLCVAGCDVEQGKNGTQLMNAMLPILLQTGITNTVAEVRAVSLMTVSKLVGSAGKSLKPFLPTLIPALITATGELESNQLSYISTVYGARTDVQEAIDTARASAVKSHYTMETMTKCVQYIDLTIMDELVPKVVDILKNSVGLGTKIACSHFIILLTIQMGQELTPYTGKFLAVLLNQMSDRNPTVRKQFAVTIGHLVSSAKDSSIEKLFKKLETMYFKSEDASDTQSVIAHIIRTIGIQHQEVLKTYSNMVLPLTFFAMHAEKTEENKEIINLWNEIWTENSPGTETGIRQNIQEISVILQNALESPNWKIKAQAANTLSVVATKLGASMEAKYRNVFIKMLISGLSGRTWNGKEKLVKAIASICCSCKDVKTDPEINLNELINAVIKECQKGEIVYKRDCLEACGDILEALEIDRFEDLYKIVKESLEKNEFRSKDSDDETSAEDIPKKRENFIKLQETIYLTMGKAWPSNVQTQEKYRFIFIEHCLLCLPSTVRSVQVNIVQALQKYVERLTLLDKNQQLVASEIEARTSLVTKILEAMNITLDISKHLRLRKESLDVIVKLCKRLKEINDYADVEHIRKFIMKITTDIDKDNQPEVKTRMLEIKELLND